MAAAEGEQSQIRAAYGVRIADLEAEIARETSARLSPACRTALSDLGSFAAASLTEAVVARANEASKASRIAHTVGLVDAVTTACQGG